MLPYVAFKAWNYTFWLRFPCLKCLVILVLFELIYLDRTSKFTAREYMKFNTRSSYRVQYLTVYVDGVIDAGITFKIVYLCLGT